MTINSTAAQLRNDLEATANQFVKIIQEVPVIYSGDQNIAGYTFHFPEYRWKKPNPSQDSKLIQIKRNYENWIELLKSVFRTATNNIESKIKEADSIFRKWIELEDNHSLTNDRKTNEAKFRNVVSEFSSILDIIDSSIVSQIMVIPDTNSIVSHTTPSEYRELLGEEAFTFLLLPTVMAELDQLKNHYKNPDYREKAKKAITRIKGWRNQGSLCDGVKVDRTITVRAIANDPNMDKALSWLKRDVRDDQILASILELQAANPSDRILLITGDINLLNKADAARISTADFDPS